MKAQKKVVTVHVTQDDIDKGDVDSTEVCAIGRALRREVGRDAYLQILPEEITIDDDTFPCPAHLRKFQNDGMKHEDEPGTRGKKYQKPFTFKLEYELLPVPKKIRK